MYTIYKQMLNNRIIQIIVTLWLVQQQPLTLCVAGQPAMANAITPAITAADQQQNLKVSALKQKQLMHTNDTVNNNNGSGRNANPTGVGTTSSNKLNVKNTDTQMTLKLKDATARNAYMINNEETLLVPQVTVITYVNITENIATNSQQNPFKFPTNKPLQLNNSLAITTTTKTFTNGQTRQNIMRSPEIQPSNNAGNKSLYNTPHTNHLNTPALLNITHKQLKGKSLLTMTSVDGWDGKETKAKAKPAIINNLVGNNNLINKTVTKVNKDLGNLEKGYISRTVKDTEAKHVEKIAVLVSIENDNSLQTANYTSRSTSAKLQKKPEEEKYFMKAEEKIKQAHLNTTNLSHKNNEKERINNKATEFQKKGVIRQESSDVLINNVNNATDMETFNNFKQSISKKPEHISTKFSATKPISLKAFGSKELSSETSDLLSHRLQHTNKDIENNIYLNASLLKGLSAQTFNSLTQKSQHTNKVFAKKFSNVINSQAQQDINAGILEKADGTQMDNIQHTPNLNNSKQFPFRKYVNKNLRYTEHVQNPLNFNVSKTSLINDTQSNLEKAEQLHKNALKKTKVTAKLLEEQNSSLKNLSSVNGKRKELSKYEPVKVLKELRNTDQLDTEKHIKLLIKQESELERKLLKLKQAEIKITNKFSEALKTINNKITELKDNEINREKLQKQIDTNISHNPNTNKQKLITHPLPSKENIKDINKYPNNLYEHDNVRKTSININRRTLDKHQENSGNSIFRRQKRLKTNILYQVNATQQTLATFQKHQPENHTAISHELMTENRTAVSSTQKPKTVNPPTVDTQSIIDINKIQSKSRNESVELETADVRKLKFTDEQKQLPSNKAAGNGNNMTAINNNINNKRLDGNLKQSKENNNQNIQLIGGKHVVSDINAINGMTTITATETTTKTEDVKTTPTTYKMSPTAVLQQKLLEFQTLFTTILAPTTTTISKQPFIISAESPQDSTATSFTTANGPLSIHDVVNARLTIASAEKETMPTTYTAPLMQLVSGTSNTALPFLYNKTISSFALPSSSSPSSAADLLSSTFATTSTTPSWPVKHASVMEGNVILGGLMMVHSREDSITCGPIMPQGGIQALEAMLYTLDQVNKQQLLPNITLGAHILDDCDKDTYGLEMAVDFIKDDDDDDNDDDTTTQYPFNSDGQTFADDFFFETDNNKYPYLTHMYQQPLVNQQQQHSHAHVAGAQTGDYFAASPRSGRHRGRATSHIIASHNLLHSHSKKFRSLPETEQDYQRLLYNPPAQRHWPVKREAVVEGNVILGGLMMVHSREDTITCGPIMPQGGIQALEAMLYTIDRINEMDLLPNITLGAHILDDCDKDSYGLEMAVDFIKGSISNIDDAEYHCNKTTVRKVISGVVGAASSVTSIQVANLLRLFRIPQVSFFSTSPELSNKQRFEYFSRTIPSDHYQVKAMVEIVKRMGWSYVSIIYEESNYGIKAFEELEELLARHSICIAVKEKLVKDSGVADEIAYDSIVQKLLTKPRARGAIIFGSDQEVREVMRAVRRNNATGAFSWIGSDGWSARNLVSDGNEPEVEGTLSVQPQANPVKGFEEYFLNLTVENNQRNPWFVEFWEDHFQCRYPGSTSTPYNNYNRTCTTTERLSREGTNFEDQLQFVSDAVMAFAYALRDMHRDLCGGRPSLCESMKPTKGADLLKYLRKVQFQGLSGDHFRFDSNGDGPARYNIIHFKQSNKGQYHWVKVGEYYEGELRLNMSEVQFKLLHPKPPESVCSLPCERGQAKKYVEGESCCWHCFNCSTYQIRHPLDETQCIKCDLGTLPDATKQFCHTIPEVYLRPESAWAIGAMSFSATGILVTLFIVGVFVRHNDTPIVRASGRELSYILLAGILMCYAVTFALVLKPTNIVCAIQRFSVGFCFTVVYAALLTKTNRIARIFKAGKQSAKRPSFISPKSQLVICSFFISLQILINGVWMLIAPSHAKHYHPTREDNLLVCDSYIDASYVIAFFYPIVLIVVCTVYAVLTRKIPEAFNESKHIGFTMYTTCVIWLAFVPLYFGTANHVPLRITSMSVTISLSASVTIACLFSPKLYIILIRPERNVRQSMMPPRYTNMHRTANTGPSSMMAAAVVTAATCAQEEKIQQHITPSNTEHSVQKKKLCEMATQTIAITSIFTNLDSATYNQIPYADQYVPNNNHNEVSDKENHLNNTKVGIGTVNEMAQTVANNNKINQQQHQHQHQHNTNHMNTIATTITSNNMMMAATINGIACTTTTPLNMSSCSNHLLATTNAATTTPATTHLHDESTGCIKSNTVLTTSL